MPGVELDVVDREGQPVGEPNKGGFLVHEEALPALCSAPSIGDPDRYARDWNTIPGVYFTGDVALRDADGYYMVVGRADDVLNVAGHRIGLGGGGERPGVAPVGGGGGGDRQAR